VLAVAAEGQVPLLEQVVLAAVEMGVYLPAEVLRQQTQAVAVAADMPTRAATEVQGA
jgi:hypothetical protein